MTICGAHSTRSSRSGWGSDPRTRGHLPALLPRRPYDPAMRVAFLTPWDISDPSAWSGIVKPAFESLSRIVETVPVVVRSQHALLDRGLARLHGELHLGAYLPALGIASSRRSSAEARRRICASGADVVLAFGAGDMLALGRQDAPVVQLSEATLESLLDYYPTHTGLSRLARAQARHCARAGVKATSGFVATSPWAAQRVMEDHRVPSSRILVAPLGPGVDASGAGATADDRFQSLKMVIVAKDWERKNGERSLAIARAVHRADPTSSLVVIGRELPIEDEGWITSRARLTGPELAEIYRGGSLLLEMTRANTGGVVLADAASAGLPVAANSTGAIPSLLEGRGTGLLVEPGDSSADVAGRILAARDGGQLARMSVAAQRLYHDEWNWETWARRTAEFLASFAS